MSTTKILIAVMCASLLLWGVATAQDGAAPSGEETKAPERPGGDKTDPAPKAAEEGETGGETPAEGEETPADAEAAPGEESPKPAEGTPEPAPVKSTDKPSDPKSAENGKDPKTGAESPFKKTRGHDLLKIQTGPKGSAKYQFTDGSIYQSKGEGRVEVHRVKEGNSFKTSLQLKNGTLQGTCKCGSVCCTAGPVKVFALDTLEEVSVKDGVTTVVNKGKGKVGVKGLGLNLELRLGQGLEIKKQVKALSTNKGDVGLIRGGKVELLKPGQSAQPGTLPDDQVPDPAICKRLKSPAFLKDWFTIDTGEDGNVEFLLQDGGKIYTPEEEAARFEVFFLEKSPRETLLNIGAGSFSFDLGADLMTVSLPKVMSVSARNAVFRAAFVDGFFRIESLGGERLQAVSAKELLKNIRIKIIADARSTVDTEVDDKTKDVVFTVSPETEKPVYFTVLPAGKVRRPGLGKKLVAPPGSRLTFAGNGKVVTVKIPKPEGMFAATIPLTAGTATPGDWALQDHGDLVEIQNVSPGNP